MCKTNDIYKNLQDSLQDILEKEESLGQKQSIADNKIIDIQHFIEITPNLNASQGYIAYSMLKEALKERRDIKDEIDNIHTMLKTLGDYGMNKAKMQSLVKKMDRRLSESELKRERRKYNVRIMTDVFGETIG